MRAGDHLPAGGARADAGVLDLARWACERTSRDHRGLPPLRFPLTIPAATTPPTPDSERRGACRSQHV